MACAGCGGVGAYDLGGWFRWRGGAGSGGAEGDANLQLLEAGVGLHAAGDAGGGLAESDQLDRLLRAWGARQGRERHGLEQVGLSLRVAAEEYRGGALERQIQLNVI